jgi:endonuclease YncB( thermonuclease family)
MHDEYWRAFVLNRVIDGDTLEAARVDLGYHVSVNKIIYRLARINAPESHKPGGPEATDYHTQWYFSHANCGGYFAQSTKTDDWRRYIAEIECGAGHNLSDDMLSSGHAVRYVHG